MDNLHEVRSTITAAFLSLPLLFISFTAFLAISLGAPGLIMLFVGQILMSFVTWISHILTEPFRGTSNERFMFVEAENGTLIPGTYESGLVNVTPSYWITHVVFFLSYLLANAVEVFKADASKASGADWKVSNRRSKALAIIIVLSLAMLTLIVTRIAFTGAETPLGALLGCLLGAIGGGWYMLAKKIGARESDIFGIVQQMAPNTGTPTTCVYTPIA